MDAYIECRIAPGQFSGEYAVELKTARGESVSLFAPREFLDFDREPQRGEVVEGRLQVVVVREDEQTGLTFVRLPRRALENGHHLVVKSGHIRQEA